MSKVRIAINGMGRIGRTLIREYFNTDQALQLDLVAVNNPGTADHYLHLLRYDSIHGRFNYTVKKDGDDFIINNKKIRFFHERNPTDIPWEDLGVDIVIDATGIFKNKGGLGMHMRGSVKKVIMCAPGTDLDATFVMGINHESYDSKNHHIVSNASCTTNCLAPIVKVLNDKFGIKNGMMTTIHSYTSDQRILDGSHKDPRRARAAAISMIPTTTGAAKAVGLVIPELAGKLDGYAVRVPTPNVSLVDLTANLNKNVTVEEVNQAMKQASETYLKGILDYSDEPLVSNDYIGQRASSFFDSLLTNIVDGNMVKVVSWYDNEAAFSNRVLDLTTYIAKRL